MSVLGLNSSQCKSLWMKASAKCPKCKCLCFLHLCTKTLTSHTALPLCISMDSPRKYMSPWFPLLSYQQRLWCSTATWMSRWPAWFDRTPLQRIWSGGWGWWSQSERPTPSPSHRHYTPLVETSDRRFKKTHISILQWCFMSLVMSGSLVALMYLKKTHQIL